MSELDFLKQQRAALAASLSSIDLRIAALQASVPFVEGKYRFQKKRLFQRAHAKREPFVYVNSLGQTILDPIHDIHYDMPSSTNPVAGDCQRSVGATRELICQLSRWPWKKNGDGDWIDSVGVKQGSSAFVSATMPGGAPAGSLTLDVTSAFQYIMAQSTWAALLLKAVGTGTLGVNGVLGPAAKSVVDITYVDGTTESLTLWYTGSGVVSGYSNAHEDIVQVFAGVNGFLEFDRPTTVGVAIESAFLRLKHGGCGPMTLSVFVISPDIPDTMPLAGLAAAYPLDAGIAADPRVILSQLVKDSTVITDVLDTVNSGSYSAPYVTGGQPVYASRQEAAFDPRLWNQPALTPVEQAKRLPHRNLGKWVGGAWPVGNPKNLPGLEVVHSDYNQKGFVPLAPGLGAIHLTMPKQAVLPGQFASVSGEIGTDVDLWFPYDKIGKIREVNFRYYILLGDGWEPSPLDLQFNYTGSGAQLGKWPEQLVPPPAPASLSARSSDNSGKMFLGAQHLTERVITERYKFPTRINAQGQPDDTILVEDQSFGYGGSSGGPYGYQGRQMWVGGHPFENGGPVCGGLTLGIELYDMQHGSMDDRPPPGQPQIRGWDASWQSGFSQYGGLGYIAKDSRWRCVEVKWRLNDNEPYTLPPRGTHYAESGSKYPPTGFLECRVDGILASQSPNFGFQRLPKLDWAKQIAANAPLDISIGSPNRLRPIINCTDDEYLGFASLAGNLYYGGRSPCPREKHLFLNGLVVTMGLDYIGPMAGVAREHGGLGV